MIITLELCAFVRFPVIVIFESHSPTEVDETAKDKVGGEEDPPLPPARAAIPPIATNAVGPGAATYFGGTFAASKFTSKEL